MKFKNPILLTALFTAIFFSAIPSSRADFFKASPWTTEKIYWNKISHKLGFGFLNISTGWTAIFYEPYYEGWKGLGTGIFYVITDSAGGLLHAATFPIPVDIPLPQGGISYEYDR